MRPGKKEMRRIWVIADHLCDGLIRFCWLPCVCVDGWADPRVKGSGLPAGLPPRATAGRTDTVWVMWVTVSWSVAQR